VSLKYLCRKYEGADLEEYMIDTHGEDYATQWREHQWTDK